MFEINELAATIKNVNPRAEIHGEEHELACDIALEFSLSNQRLKLLDEKLLPALYQREPLGTENDKQETMDLEEDEFLPHRKFPQLGEFPWDYKGVGYTFQIIEDRLNGDEIIQVSDCKVNNFKIECEEGGTIKLKVRVQGYPNEETIGELCRFIKEEERVSLIAPKVTEDDVQQDIEEEAPAPETAAEKPDDEERPDDEAMYIVAVERVRASGDCSITGLQKALAIGYNRAARLIERMEQDGVITSMGENGVRVVVKQESEEDAA